MSLTEDLSRFEKLAVEAGRLTNEHPVGKRLQETFLRSIAYSWIRAALARRLFADGLDRVIALAPDRGVLLASNHRSFFDQYAILLSMWMGPTPWARRLYFPVRANFFYERPLGMLVNYLVVAGAMYPPIFRQGERAAFNKDALARVTRFLAEPGTVVGVHPEGTRGKGPDPYELLPAQPGVGQIALNARPIVIPAFVMGLSNDIVADVRANFHRDVRRDQPCIVVFGEPVDYEDLAAQRPRPVLYKKAADRFRDAILALRDRERALRAACARGEIGDDDPRWMTNRRAGVLYAHPGE